MSNFTVDPNMGFLNPTPGQDPGPDYATNQSNTNTTIGAHDHSPGKGVKVTVNGLNINTDLPINGNNITLVKTVNFTAQGASLPGSAPNLGAIYVAGNELYYNDESGNVVKMTNLGSVNAGAGSITGLPSGTASATYSSGSGTFIWQSATSTPANMDFGAAIFRNNVANSKGLTLSPPNAMAADFNVTLPTSNGSGSTAFLTYDTSNNITVGPSINGGITTSNIASNTILNANIANGTIQNAKFAAANYFVSTATGSPTTLATSASPAAITQLAGSLTTVGRPVRVQIQSAGAGARAFIEPGTASIQVLLYIDGVETYGELLTQANTFICPTTIFNWFVPGLSAGVHTFAIFYISTNNWNITNATLAVQEV